MLEVWTLEFILVAKVCDAILVTFGLGVIQESSRTGKIALGYIYIQHGFVLKYAGSAGRTWITAGLADKKKHNGFCRPCLDLSVLPGKTGNLTGP